MENAFLRFEGLRVSMEREEQVTARDLVRAAGSRAALARILAREHGLPVRVVKRHVRDLLRAEDLLIHGKPPRGQARRALDRVRASTGAEQEAVPGEVVAGIVRSLTIELGERGGGRGMGLPPHSTARASLELGGSSGTDEDLPPRQRPDSGGPRPPREYR